jgi:hypothetical protein
MGKAAMAIDTRQLQAVVMLPGPQPDSEFAQVCADYEWTGYSPQSFALDELMSELLPQLEQDGIVTGVFYTPGARDVMPTAGLLRVDIADALKRRASGGDAMP